MSKILDLVPNIIRGELASVRTISTAKIIKYYPDRQTADVQPLIGDLFIDELPVKPPILVDVPLIIYNSGGGILSFPIVEGDNLMLLFSDRPLTNWKKSLGEEFSVPNQKRMHSLNDAIGLIGLNPINTVEERDNESVVLRFKTDNGDSAVKINNDGSVDIVQGETTKLKLTSDGNFELLGDTFLNGNFTMEGDLKVTGNTELTGSVDIVGDTTVKGALLFDGNVQITGNLTVGGDVTSTGEVKAGAVHLSTHAHAAGALLKDSVGGAVTGVTATPT